jgi:hypothetical protein
MGIYGVEFDFLFVRRLAEDSADDGDQQKCDDALLLVDTFAYYVLKEFLADYKKIMKTPGVAEQGGPNGRLCAKSELLFPAINVNDYSIKSSPGDVYGCCRFLLKGILRATDVMIGEKPVDFIDAARRRLRAADEAARGWSTMGFEVSRTSPDVMEKIGGMGYYYLPDPVGTTNFEFKCLEELLKRPTSTSTASAARRPHRGLKRPTSTSRSSAARRPHRGLKSPTSTSRASAARRPHRGLKRPTSTSRASADRKPHRGLKRPTSTSSVGGPPAAQGLEAFYLDVKSVGGPPAAQGLEASYLDVKRARSSPWTQAAPELDIFTSTAGNFNIFTWLSGDDIYFPLDGRRGALPGVCKKLKCRAGERRLSLGRRCPARGVSLAASPTYMTRGTVHRPAVHRRFGKTSICVRQPLLF